MLAGSAGRVLLLLALCPTPLVTLALFLLDSCSFLPRAPDDSSLYDNSVLLFQDPLVIQLVSHCFLGCHTVLAVVDAVL